MAFANIGLYESSTDDDFDLHGSGTLNSNLQSAQNSSPRYNNGEYRCSSIESIILGQ